MHGVGEWHKYRKRKKWPVRYGMKDFSVFRSHFSQSVLTISREKLQKNEREKSWQDVSVSLFENIPTTTEKNDIKVIYIFISNVKPYIQIHI